MTARAVRARYGRTKAPMSTTKKAAARRSNAVTVGMVGATLGALAGGPPGALLGGAIGALIGHETDPE